METELTPEGVNALRTDFLRRMAPQCKGFGMSALASLDTPRAGRLVMVPNKEASTDEVRSAYERVVGAPAPAYRLVEVTSDKEAEGLPTLAGAWQEFKENMTRLAASAPAWSANRSWTTSREGRAAR